MKKVIIIVSILLGYLLNSAAQQGVRIGDIYVIATEMTESQRIAIASPATDLLIYQTDGTMGLYYYTGTVWISLQNQCPQLISGATFIASCVITASSTASVGTLTASSNGGVGPYSYAWDGAASSATTSTVTGMPPGTYNLTVTDVNGCTATANTSWSCGMTSSTSASLGTLTVLIGGGVSNTYIIDMQDSYGDGWNGCSLDVSINGSYYNNYTLPTGSAGQSTFTVPPLSTVTFSYNVGLFNNEVSYQILNGGSQLFSDGPGPNSGLVFTHHSQPTSLAPYSYVWDGAASSATTSTVTGMPPGTYNVTVTDATGCTTTSSASWSCGITSSVTASLGTLTASSNGGLAPYSYAWDGAASSATTSTVTGMPLGTYNVTVTDANGCTATSSASYSCGLIVTVPEQLGTLHASPSVGVLPYSYQWDVAAGSQTTASVSGMPLEGAYTVTVTDADGCTATGTGNLVYNIGDYGPAGGIVFYLPPNATTDLNGDGVYDIGLECAPSDQGTAIWGCQGTNIPTATGIGSGAANTLAIEAGCTTPGTAADICANLSLGGYSDWFLPSKDELNAMYLLSAPWLTGPGGFSNADYWSSSQHTQYTAYRQGFWGGYVGNGLNKNDYSWHVRAVRAF